MEGVVFECAACFSPCIGRDRLGTLQRFRERFTGIDTQQLAQFFDALHCFGALFAVGVRWDIQ